MGIDSRGSNAFMTKNLLKGSNIWAALHKGTQRTNDGMPVEEDVPTYKYFYVKQRNRRMQIELRIMFMTDIQILYYLAINLQVGNQRRTVKTK